MSRVEIRQATIEDASLIHQFIVDLAIYEKAESEVLATVTDIENALFGAETTTKAVICNFDNKPIGFAVYFFNFSTWLGKHGLYLEDLYVSPEYRDVGAGKALLKHLANIAVSKECGRFEWNVLDWNEPAIQFYESIGAKPQNEWVGYRLTGKALEAFAGG
ncbi:GNAT family N-acetyltransferase [Halomonas sp. ISL-60]|uniref:GNAT family N-acetyltransferase n=1 Tax=Halomonas sp. ISL-56 TaxID=2819149 RepID=UPI001BECFE33|nr:GNAT family N-acetyltransferase [Halomonas sp. ISL-56]MBT2771092.1 GNAT family N-acetyltransferase [Halomonas sp. ISL-60]MBT2799832.1 GNAT family N-acetyltransferase [Halomonas sp. ISL-56]